MNQTVRTEESMLHFSVAGKTFAIALSEVYRLISLPRRALSPLPFNLERRVAGLFSFSGAVFPLAGIKGLEPRNAEAPKLTILLLDAGGKIFGIAVDSADFVSEGTDESGCIPIRAEELYSGRFSLE